MTGDYLIQYTIYRHPKDFPEFYAVRKWLIDAKGLRPFNVACLCQTLDEAREVIPWGMHCLTRDPQDDPVIVEVWT